MKLILSLLVILSVCNPARAQHIKAEINADPDSNVDTNSVAEIEVYLFESGEAVRFAPILIDGAAVAKTDEDGFAILQSFTGLRTIEFVLNQGRTLKYPAQFKKDQPGKLFINIRGESLVSDFEKTQRSIEKKRIVGQNVVELQGTVKDAESGAQLRGAKIFFMGIEEEAVSDVYGNFRVKVPVGQHTLTVVHPKYSSKTIKDLEISTRAKTISIELESSGLKLDDFVVLAPKVQGSVSALIELRRNTSNVAEVLGAEQISKSGDSDVAASLKRVTGLTLVDGKFVYVRGLGERYSSILLNGFNLPSPDPYRRVIPLDMFPTSVLESMVIQKSYSPDRPGEFGGGTIEMRTKSIPKKFFFKYSFGSSVEDYENFKSYNGGKTDALGFDDGTRALPVALKEALAGNRELREVNPFNPEGFTAEELTTLSRSLSNNYSIKSEDPEVPYDIKVASGGQLDLGVGRFGLMGSVLYKNSFDQDIKQQSKYLSTGEELVESESRRIEENEKTVNLALSLDFGFQWNKKNRIEVTNLLLRKTTDTVEINSGTNAEGENTIDTTLDYIETQLRSHQLRGSHEDLFAGNGIDWRVSQSQALRSNPDQRFYRFEEVDSEYRFSNRNDGNQRLYNELVDDIIDYGFDLSIPVSLGSIVDSFKIRTGASLTEKRRENDTRRFTFSDKRTNGSAEDLKGDINEVLGQSAIGRDGFLLVESTRATDNYFAKQRIGAIYALMESEITSKLKILAGARYENSKQEVTTFDLHNKDNLPIRAELETVDILPVYTATYKLNRKGNMQLRASYSETLSRPDFRELSSSTYTDDIDNIEVEGNPELETAVISNSDLRWEYYFSSDEQISFGGFYKYFEKPIEAIIKPGTEGKRSFDNAKFARNYGLEFDTRFRLKPMSKNLRNFTIGTNVSRILSKVEIDEASKSIQTSDVRPLQGQSPYVFNFQLEYDRKKSGTTASLLYNVFGQRITEVGTSKRPDIIEDPFYQLDFVLKQKIGKTYSVGLKAKNLLDPYATARQGAEVTRRYKKGRAFSLAFSGSY